MLRSSPRRYYRRWYQAYNNSFENNIRNTDNCPLLASLNYMVEVKSSSCQEATCYARELVEHQYTGDLSLSRNERNP